ncbi:MAG: SDR family oxidoreductase [Candidatus Woesearchaeota archaeon]|jgi:nucleoside-diphosphate-sugar epimerase
MEKPKKILIVGGAGYVGSILTKELLERGYAVKVLDRLFFGTVGIEDVKEKIELVVGDIRHISPTVLDDVEAVINLSGLSNDPTAEYNPEANYEMNTIATAKLAQLCKQKGIKRYIFASSCSIYDIGETNEDKDVILDETSVVSPKAAYSRSKYEAEKLILAMQDQNFCPVILRKGTIYGFSPRMRYDLVVNTFIKDAISKGKITLYYGGEMWRPLVEVRDVAKAYIAVLQADEEKVKGQIFNVVFKNFRIAELALHVQKTLRENGIAVEIITDYTYKGVRNYRVSGKKIQSILNFTPSISIEESVKNMLDNIKKHNYHDFDNPRYYNIKWMQMLEEADKIIKVTGSVFGIQKNNFVEDVVQKINKEL